MGKSQRTKGAVYERDIAKLFSDALGGDFKRNIGQARDGGNDIDVGPLVVECKRRKSLKTIVGWLKQAEAAADRRTSGPKYPIVVAREDAGTSLVICNLDDFLALVKPGLTGGAR